MTDIVVCVDGLDPAYLDAHETPEWDRLAEEGTAGACDAVVPTLTNVNNVSITTASFPVHHGITGNSYYDREADELVYMEDPAYLQRETVLANRSAAGETVAVLVAKLKLEAMVGRGCDISASAQQPPDWLVDAVGEAPGIYSGEASAWLFEAAEHVLEAHDPDLLYVSTTDVVPHKHAPGAHEATAWIDAIDAGIGSLSAGATRLVATADHGMNQKSTCTDLAGLLAREGYPAEVVQLIRDEHTYHHQNLGGAAYVYLHEHAADDIEWLVDAAGIEAVLPAAEAVKRFQLPKSRIGDAMVLASPEGVIGPVDDGVSASVDLRSHGSVHEQTVPYLTTESVRLSHNLEAFDVVA